MTIDLTSLSSVWGSSRLQLSFGLLNAFSLMIPTMMITFLVSVFGEVLRRTWNAILRTAQHCISIFCHTSNIEIAHHKVKSSAVKYQTLFSISKSKPQSSLQDLWLQPSFVIQVHLPDRRPGVGQDERLLCLARQGWHAPGSHQKAAGEDHDALRFLFRHTRLWMDPRNWSQALRRV